MIGCLKKLRALLRGEDGSMVIEVAVIAPTLISLAIGGFEVSTMVARQSELQSAAGEAAAVVRATPKLDAEGRTTVRNILKHSTGLTDEQVTVVEIYRCGTADSYVAASTMCADPDTISKYIRVDLSDTYQPVWNNFGLGSPMNFRISRTIQVG